MVSSDELNRILSRIIEVSQPDAVILFGSYASGNATEESDLDFLLIKQTNELPVNRAASIRKALRDILYPMDILVYTPDEIEKNRNKKFTFIHEVFKTGKILYGRP